MDTRHHLLVSLDERSVDGVLGCGAAFCGADVVYAFEDHGVFDSGVGEYVSVDSAEGIGTQTVV